MEEEAAAAEAKAQEEALAAAMLAEFEAEMAEDEEPELADDDILAMFAQDLDLDGEDDAHDAHDAGAEMAAEDQAMALAVIRPEHRIACTFFASDAGCFLGKACKFLHAPQVESR